MAGGCRAGACPTMASVKGLDWDWASDSAPMAAHLTHRVLSQRLFQHSRNAGDLTRPGFGATLSYCGSQQPVCISAVLIDYLHHIGQSAAVVTDTLAQGWGRFWLSAGRTSGQSIPSVAHADISHLMAVDPAPRGGRLYLAWPRVCLDCTSNSTKTGVCV